MSGKVVSLFRNPEFARRAQERAEKELVDQLELLVRPGPARSEPEIEIDALEAFLNEVLGES